MMFLRSFRVSWFWLAVALFLFEFTTHVPARNFEPSTNAAVAQWYATVHQPNSVMSCCGEADGYWSDDFEQDGDSYVAIITDDRDIPRRRTIPVGTKIRIPNDKLTHGEQPGPPDGHGVVFIGMTNDQVYCYFPPNGT